MSADYTPPSLPGAKRQETSKTLLQQVIERFKEYVTAQHNASAWWNDPYAYRTMRWIEQIEKAPAPETGPVDYIQFGWIPYHEKQGCDPDSYVEHEEDRTEIIDGWRWVPAYAAVGSVKAAPERCRSCLGYQGENLLETQCTLSEGHSGPHQYASDPRPAQKAEVVHHPGCWKLHSPSGQGNCNCDAENGDER